MVRGIRDVKVGQNPWTNSGYHIFKSGWVEYSLQILVRINFLPDPPRTHLTNSAINKGLHIFFVLGWVGCFFFPANILG